MRFFKHLIVGFLLVAVAASVCLAGDTAEKIKLNVKEFKLENGMLFLIVERPTTPQVACRVAIRAGSALEEAGKTGIAHMLEHMMFKGTKNFGTLDLEKDRQLQTRIEAAYQVVLAEEKKREPDQELIREKSAEMDNLRLEVQKIYVPQAFSSQLGRNGAVGVNAFTSKDQTQYVMSVPSDMLEQWFSMVSEQLFEPSWREFYVEKEIVQREWAFRYINSPGGAAWLDLEAMAYTAHPYHNPVIGWKSDMEKFSTKDAVAFHTKFYNPTNAVCVLVGDVTVEKAKLLAEVYFERYPKRNLAPETVTQEPPQGGPRKSIRFLRGARTPLVRIGFHGAGMGTKDFYALDVVTMVLTQGRGARMTQNIVNKGLAVGAWAHNPDNRYGGMIIVGGSPNEPHFAAKDPSEEQKSTAYLKACEGLEDILLAEIEKLKNELISEGEVERIKKLNQRAFLERMRSNEALAGSLASTEAQIGWQYMTGYLEKIGEVTPEEIRRVARKYLQEDNKTSAYIIPGGKPQRPPEHYAEVRSVTGLASADAVRPDTFTNNSNYETPAGWRHPLSFERKPKRIEYPKPETMEVENAPIFYIPDFDLPLIDLTLLIKAGSVDVDDTRIGLSELLSDCLIRGGTQKHSPAELAMVLDQDAIGLGISVGEEETVVHLSTMKEDWHKGLALLQEILTVPRFDNEVLNVVKRQALIGLERQGGRAQTVSRREGMVWHFKGHPYGRDPLKGLETIPTITREDLAGFLKTYFVPSNMVVAIAGHIEKAEVVAGLGKLLGALPKQRAPERKLNAPAETPPVLGFIHKPGQVQSQIWLGLHSVTRTNPAYWKMSLLTDIFGGSDSLLYTRLRDDLGLVYSAGFYQAYKWKAGLLVGYIGCKGDKTSEAILETVDIMKGLQKDVPEKRFERKKLDVLNSFVFNVDTPMELAEVYSRYHMRREPLDTLERIQDAFISASREELRDLAGKLLEAKKLQVFIVGDKTIKVKTKGGLEVTLEEDLKVLAKKLDLPFQEIELR